MKIVRIVGAVIFIAIVIIMILSSRYFPKFSKPLFYVTMAYTILFNLITSIIEKHRGDR